MVNPNYIRESVTEIRERIAHACRVSSLNTRKVKLMAVTKTFPLLALIAAVEAGVDIIGENKVQEAYEKYSQMPDFLRQKTPWHMIGSLQTNKVKRCLDVFDVIESVNRVNLVEEIERRAERQKRDVEIFIEVNISEEDSKQGVSPSELDRLVEFVVSSPHLRLRGLMTIGPASGGEKETRAAFASLREMRDRLEEKLGIKMPELSMGMSGDFELAVMEGSTIVRIGRSLFGTRM